MKARDVAFFVSIQGILLGSAFLLSSGETEVDTSNRQSQQSVETQSWINDTATTQAVARQMNMAAPSTLELEEAGKTDSVVVALERARQQRSWVF